MIAHKPKHRMKTLVTVVKDCIYYSDCRKCNYRQYSNCQQLLMADCLYYLEQTLEKSERRPNAAN